MSDDHMTQAVGLLLAIGTMAERMAGMGAGLGHLTCPEFESVAGVLVASGFDDEVRRMLLGHAQADDHEGDLHADLRDVDDESHARVTAHIIRIREGL